MKLVDEFTPV